MPPKANKQRSAKPETDKISIKGKSVLITNRDKIYWPKEKYTKGDLIEYYAQVAPYMLPYLKNRPLSLNRFPNGINGLSFYQKDIEIKNLPAFVSTEPVYSDSKNGTIDYMVCKNEATIIYMANLGCIEINPWNSRIGHLDNPDYIIMDLDPGKIDFKYVVKTAIELKAVCDEFDIPCYCKTSGATGLHIYIPLHAKYEYNLARQFAELLARITYERIPEFTSIERSISKRTKKVYIDFLQNSRGQTIASVFSVRPKPGATVSTPLSWNEVNLKLDIKKFTIKNILKSIEKRNEYFKPVLSTGIDLKKILLKMNRADQP